jgi:hypothetical protein
MLSLQELCYTSLKEEEKNNVPENIRNTLIHSIAFHILKYWRRSTRYRRWFINNLIQDNVPLTKNTIAFVLTYRIFPEKVTIYDFTQYLHGYFHNQEPEAHITNNQMDRILFFFKKDSYNNAHNFFSHLHSMAKNAQIIPVDKDTIQKMLAVLDKDILLRMYSKS